MAIFYCQIPHRTLKVVSSICFGVKLRGKYFRRVSFLMTTLSSSSFFFAHHGKGNIIREMSFLCQLFEPLRLRKGRRILGVVHFLAESRKQSPKGALWGFISWKPDFIS